MSERALAEAKERLGSLVLSTGSQHGDETIVVHAAEIAFVMHILKSELGFNFLVDLTCVDYLGREPRFELVYHLRCMATGERLRVKAPVAEPVDGSSPQIATLTALWPGANWLEREVWDLYGIRFDGHPDLRRILMYEQFVGHPLRKDYPKDKRQPLVRREANEY